jgi:predicted permease
MSEILLIILTIIAPIIIVAIIGVLLDRFKSIDARTLSRVVIYVASPALSFWGMANATMQSSEVLGLFSFAVLQAALITFLAWLVTRLFKMDRLTASAFVMGVGFMNTGNYGIPFNEFAFGQPGLERALVINVGEGLYVFSVGVFVASWGRASIKQALRNAFSVPTPYAAVAGLAVNFGGIEVPSLIMRVVQTVQGAAIPLMLLLLGIQISRVKPGAGRWNVVLGAAAMRLLCGPLTGGLVATLLGLQGISLQVAIIEAAMPTAVITTILAVEFRSDTQVVSSIVLVTTVLSIFTLSVLLYFLW